MGNIDQARIFPSGDLSIINSTYPNFVAWKEIIETYLIKAVQELEIGHMLGPPSRPTGYDAGVSRVDFVRFDPTNSNTMYVSTPDGGLWKTTNGNATLQIGVLT
ncbi:MAG: hypothetical protein IPH36_14845 [Saprospiraceae bacterium]|nr:hypothetical protein [Saprospiraceae bacterium]